VGLSLVDPDTAAGVSSCRRKLLDELLSSSLAPGLARQLYASWRTADQLFLIPCGAAGAERRSRCGSPERLRRLAPAPARREHWPASGAHGTRWPDGSGGWRPGWWPGLLDGARLAAERFASTWSPPVPGLGPGDSCAMHGPARSGV